MKRAKKSPLRWLWILPSCALLLLTNSAVFCQINPGAEIQVAVASDAAGSVYAAVWQKQLAGDGRSLPGGMHGPAGLSCQEPNFRSTR
jgi:hypothetical protein